MKSALLSGVAATVLLSSISAPAQAGTHELMPFSGDLDPFSGDILAFWGDLNPFHGDLNPFWGDISPFWGDLSPFNGDVNAFWGDLNPFHGDLAPFYGDLNPFWGDIGPFWGDLAPFWGDLDPFSSSTSAQYAQVASDLEKMFADAEQVFGAQILAQTGQNFHSGFLEGFADQYGIDVTRQNGVSIVDGHHALDDLSDADRAMFFVDFYDGLMNYSGADRVDHWMATANWRPIHTQDLSYGVDSNIGILDGAITGSSGGSSFVPLGGLSGDAGGHGVAVASLLVAPHDGSGVMGFAPHANVFSYSPFDASGSANWEDVEDGVVALAQAGAHVINMSLGKPGHVFHNNWKQILSSNAVDNAAGEVVFVKAAGNDGVTQVADVSWTHSAMNAADHLILVGSVNPAGEISSFSNTPGTACLKIQGSCARQLMDMFVVAPGEMILLDDGAGGTKRASGTSFAAPMVSGTVALIHGRWPWFQDHASETVDIIFQSATDLGAPGVDPVYGHGLLNVDAALSPLDFDNLTVFKVNTANGGQAITHMSSTALRNLVLDPGQLALAEANEEYLYAFETIGGLQRDFAIPLADTLAGQDLAFSSYNERAQSYITDRLKDWASSSFGDVVDYGGQVTEGGRFELSMSASRHDPYAELKDGELPFQVGVTITDRSHGFAFSVGHGEGAMAITGQDGFGFYSDHRPETGGVNPILGFASGDAYAMAGLRLTPKTALSLGFTTLEEDPLITDVEAPQMPEHESEAMVLKVTHDITPFLTADASYTYLDEKDGMLGANGAGALDIEGGSRSQAATFGAELALSERRLVSASATIAETRGDMTENAALTLASETVTSTAYQISARQTGLIGKKDALRVSVIQPLHVESGALNFASVQVIDRTTGEIGVVNETWELGGQRPLVGEALYARPLFDDAARVSAFARSDLSGSTSVTGAASAEVGFRFDVSF